MGIEKWEGTVISPAEVLAQGPQRFSPLRTMGKFSMYPELLHRPSSGALSIHGRFSFLCLPPKPFFTLHPKLLEQVNRRPGQHSHSPQGCQPAKMQPQPLCLGSHGKGFKLNPSDISHESAPHPGTGTGVPPDTLGLFWVAEAGPRASGKCLEFRGCETGVFPSPWGGQKGCSSLSFLA